MKTLITIVGPTAIGKTSLAIALANKFQAPILSADSRQFFKEMHIGTAKPSKEELREAPHYFIDTKSIQEEYSAGMYEKDALTVLEKIYQTNDNAILVGGSGLYIQAVLQGMDDLPSDKAIRERLNQEYTLNGITPLQEQLRALDPLHYKTMDIHNPQRVIRALEVCIHSGKPYSSFLEHQNKNRSFSPICIGLTAEREVIYERINTRVDQMITDGLIEEVKALYAYKNNHALNTVGYKELFQYLDGEITKEEAIELIKQNTRRFAKRQLTWFKKDPKVHWFTFEEKEAIVSFIQERLRM